jgi:hypothetical protein
VAERDLLPLGQVAELAADETERRVLHHRERGTGRGGEAEGEPMLPVAV